MSPTSSFFSKEIWNFIKQVIYPYKWILWGKVFIMVFWAIDISLRPYLIKTILDRITGLPPEGAYGALVGPAIFYILLSVVIVVLFRIYDYLWFKFNPDVKRDVGLVLMDRMMGHSHQLYQNHFAGSIGNKIKDVMSGMPDLVRMLIDPFFSQALAFFIAIFTFFQVSSTFAFGLVIWVSIFLIGTYLLSKTARRLSDKSAEARSTAVGSIVDTLGNMMSVRLFTGRVGERKNLKIFLDEYATSDRKRDWFFMLMHGFQGTSFVLYECICLFLLIRGYHDGVVTAGDFALVLTLNISIIELLWVLSWYVSQFSENLGNVTQGLRLIFKPLDLQDHPDAKELIIKKGTITFDNVGFHYKDIEPLFKELSVTIPGGQKVGLVGYSGSGKTTFVNLLLRLYDINEGRILIDDQDIQRATQDSLRKNIAMIPQDPSLFHRSLLENIRYGKLEATEEEVISASKAAHAHAFVMKMPLQYQALVGERGVKLSGGQRQRIAIARAILKNAPILILDEATSQLDSVTEGDIQETLWPLMHGKTTLVIAHRLSTLLKMDRILVFDRGEIVEEGTHLELLEKSGLYKTLWNAQVGGFLPDQG